MRFDAAVAHGFLANLQVTLGRRDDARALYGTGLATLEALASQDPDNALWQRWLAAFHSALGALAVADGKPAAALEPLGKARRIDEALVAKDPTNSDWRLQLGVCRSRTAEALERLDLGRARTEALAARESALAILAPCTRPLTHWKVLAPWTEALLSLGRAGEARPGVEQLAKMGYRGGEL